MNLVQVIKAFLRDIAVFSRVVVRRPLRGYQLEPARAIVDSVVNRKGLTFAVVMSRQAGKNELSAQLEAYLMNLFQQVRGSSLVKASPTYKPQTVNSRQRLMETLDNPWNAEFASGSEGYQVRLGYCRISFFSAHRSSSVVGATASVLLECDEAQDVEPDKWNKDFAPMGASTNVTTVFYGTVWTSRTFLAGTVRRLREQEAEDGIQRVWYVPWELVASEVPAYGDYVRKERERLGEGHPVFRTQYALQEIEEAGRMFGGERLAAMHGTHERQRRAVEGEVYAVLVDLAGQDEELEGAELREVDPDRDSTVVTIVRVDLEGMEDPLRGRPSYEVVNRVWWTGIKHVDLLPRLEEMVGRWGASYVVVDATGVGAGVSSFLCARLGSYRDEPRGLVVPVVFGPKVKSDLGWRMISLVETGRFRDYVDDGAPETGEFWRQVEACEFEVLPGPGQRMRWGAPAGEHDDFVISAALCGLLDDLEWGSEVLSEVIEGDDPLELADEVGF